MARRFSMDFNTLVALVMARITGPMADEIRVSHVRTIVRHTLDELGIDAEPWAPHKLRLRSKVLR